MSVYSDLHAEVCDFAQAYVQSDSDWHGTVEWLGFDPYKRWNDAQWDLWNKIMDEYDPDGYGYR